MLGLGLLLVLFEAVAFDRVFDGVVVAAGAEFFAAVYAFGVVVDIVYGGGTARCVEAADHGYLVVAEFLSDGGEVGVTM